jgi:hypothetical protein
LLANFDSDQPTSIEFHSLDLSGESRSRDHENDDDSAEDGGV